MQNIFLKGKIFKVLVVSIISIFILNILLPSVTALAAENDFETMVQENQEEITEALDQIMEYSYYEDGKWILDYAIVEDGIFTEEQYQQAEKSGELWTDVENEYVDGATERVLPALLIVAIKAVGAIIGTTIVASMTDYFLTWGLKAGCKKFKNYSAIKSFCKANGLL